MAERQPSPEELARLREAVNIAEALPGITTEIERMTSTVRGKAYIEIDNGTITPQAALTYLMEMRSNDRLLKRLTDKAALANQVRR